MRDTSAAEVDGWHSSDTPHDLQEAFDNTKRASMKVQRQKRSGSRRLGTGAAASAAASDGKRAAAAAAPSVASSRSGKSGKRSSSIASSGVAAKKGKRKAGGAAAAAPKNGKSGSVKKPAAKGKKAATGSRRSSSRGSSASARGSAARRSSSSGAGGAKRARRLTIALALSHVAEEEEEQRRALIAEEELEGDAFGPVYHVLVMEIVRAQVQQLNARQELLNNTFSALRAEGFPVGEGDEAAMDAMLDRLRSRLQSDAVDELQRLKEENTALRERLEDRSLEVEKKMSELEVLRNSMARRLARTEVDYEHLRAQAQAVIQNATLDVDRMKRELSHRIDIATSALRTPKYGSALRSLQDLSADAQAEIQDHRDRLTKLVASLGAKDTFRKDASETMHSNFPTQYRGQLRALEKDNLINILDVLSFQEGVVDTVGKALYVLTEAEHKTAVV